MSQRVSGGSEKLLREFPAVAQFPAQILRAPAQFSLVDSPSHTGCRASSKKLIAVMGFLAVGVTWS